MTAAFWATLAACAYIALIIVLFYFYYEPAHCMAVSYLPC